MKPQVLNVLKSIFDHAVDGICVCDRRGSILYANASARRLLGPGALEGVPSSICELVCARLAAPPGRKAACCLENTRHSRPDAVTCEGRFSSARPTGAPERSLRVRSTLLRMPLRWGRGLRLVVIEDVSEEAEGENRLEEWRQMLIHDLRSPLANAYGVLRELEEAPEGASLGERERELLQLGLRACRRMEGHLKAFLEVARMESGAMTARSQGMDVVGVVSDCIRDQAEVARLGGVSIHAELPDAIAALADPELLSRCVQNLLDNAVKFTPAGGSVGVSARTDGAEVLIRVSDTGPGIGPEDMPRIFDRFYQAKAPGAGRRRGGIGLGLTFCREAMRAMGGSVSVESSPGAGSAFTLRLRRSTAEAGLPGPARIPR